MTVAVVVDAARTALGARNGQLSGWHPADLAATVLVALAERNHLDPVEVEDVIMGCATQVGDQGLNLGRSAVLAAGWPESVPATTVDRRCGSSQQAVHIAAQGVVAGAYQVAVAAGVEVMSTTPPGSSVLPGTTTFGPGVIDRYAGRGGLVPPGVAAELVAEAFGLGRDDLDRLAAASQRRAWRATEAGWFRHEVVPVAARRWDRERGRAVALDTVARRDEPIRAETTTETLAALKPSFTPGGTTTAGNTAPSADGAAAVLVMSQRRAEQLSLAPRARFRAFAVAGADPRAMLTATIPATALVLDRARLGIDDIDRVEVNEASASAVLAWARQHGADLDRVNVCGGAIALGNPLGCAGTRLLTTLVNELERSRGRYGLQVTGGDGVATATVIERVA
ncbi:MAG: thiolase family protein [Acidimicrobiales bacterium]